MYTSQTQWIEAQKHQVDTLQAIGSTVFQAAEKFAQLNLETTRAFLADGRTAAQGLLAVKDPQELAAMATGIAQPGAEKLSTYARSAYGIASTVSAEFGRVVEAQLAEAGRKVSELIDLTAKSAPAGSEHAIGLLRNSVTAATQAVDAVAKATRQASETAESNMVAAVTAATDVVKGKSKKSA